MSDTHTITVAVDGRYPHGGTQRATVVVAGDGGLDHMLDTFRAALMAAGYSARIAESLDVREESDE